MNNKIKKDKEELLESAIMLYLSVVEDACALREVDVVSIAHDSIHRDNYKTETDYYTALTEYIIANL
ncbi:hypothetical protein [Clostridium gasigenes]|uniref:Uncharacterized protein n=1 Tax=Clostridium gasigenes TaxID=94869 RepID=A0A1H0S226_9CLOT|nr:hypothetical protein [Clostridium gasigenes]SDP35754.1 hypothetical protein SAMN04488529_104124 [Clostridium gasigenes]